MSSARFSWHRWFPLRLCSFGGLPIRHRRRSSVTAPTCPRRYPSRSHWTCHRSWPCVANHLGLTSSRPPKLRGQRQRHRSCRRFLDLHLRNLRGRNPFEPSYERRQIESVAHRSFAFCTCRTSPLDDGASRFLTSSHSSSTKVPNVACAADWSCRGCYLASRRSLVSAPDTVSVIADVISKLSKHPC